MKATGIVRRLDELGRVVIPKEIRKTLRLKEGDPLEIFTDKNEIRFKKYSPIGSLENFAEDVVSSLYDATEKTALITDCDTVLFAKGAGAREFDRRRISIAVESVLSNRSHFIANVSDGDKLIDLVEAELGDYSGQLIVPIIVADEIVGSIIILSKDNDKKITVEDIKISQFASDFLARQFL